jgi:hypothetical protein
MSSPDPRRRIKPHSVSAAQQHIDAVIFDFRSAVDAYLAANETGRANEIQEIIGHLEHERTTVYQWEGVSKWTQM